MFFKVSFIYISLISAVLLTDLSCVEQWPACLAWTTLIISTAPFRIEIGSKDLKNTSGDFKTLIYLKKKSIYGKNTRPFSPLDLLFYFS